MRIVNFIEEALQAGQAVLVQGQRIDQRVFTIISLYLMLKYRWSLDKAISFLQSKQKAAISVYDDLQRIEASLRSSAGFLSTRWDENVRPKNVDEATMTNTYLNSAVKKVDPPTPLAGKRRLVWVDELEQGAIHQVV